MSGKATKIKFFPKWCNAYKCTNDCIPDAEYCHAHYISEVSSESVNEKLPKDKTPFSDSQKCKNFGCETPSLNNEKALGKCSEHSGWKYCGGI